MSVMSDRIDGVVVDQDEDCLRLAVALERTDTSQGELAEFDVIVWPSHSVGAGAPPAAAASVRTGGSLTTVYPTAEALRSLSRLYAAAADQLDAETADAAEVTA